MIVFLSITIPSTAAGVADTFDAPIPSPGRYRMVGAQFAPDTATTPDGTNFTTASVQSNPSGSFVTAGSFDTSSVGNVVGTSRAFSLSGEPQYVEGGDIVRIDKAEDASGALLHGTVVIALEKQS